MHLRLGPAPRKALIGDGSGEEIDAVPCRMKVGSACILPGFGLPAGVVPLKGTRDGVILVAAAGPAARGIAYHIHAIVVLTFCKKW
jgi:hypothetical protein